MIGLPGHFLTAEAEKSNKNLYIRFVNDEAPPCQQKAGLFDFGLLVAYQLLLVGQHPPPDETFWVICLSFLSYMVTFDSARALFNQA